MPTTKTTKTSKSAHREDAFILPSLVASTQAQCLQHSSSGIGTTFGTCLALHFKCFGGLAGTGQAGRHSTFPRSQKQCCSHPVKLAGISLQLSKYCPLYSHVPLSTQRIRSGQHFGTTARKVAGSGAHSKQCGSIISNPNVDGHSIFSQ